METKYTFQYLSLCSRPFFSEYVVLYVVDGRLQNWGRHSHINGTFILWKEAFSVWTHWLETLFAEKDAQQNQFPSFKVAFMIFHLSLFLAFVDIRGKCVGDGGGRR